MIIKIIYNKPIKSGHYLCSRNGISVELCRIKKDGKKLYYIGKHTHIPLNRLEKEAKFSELINIEYE